MLFNGLECAMAALHSKGLRYLRSYCFYTQSSFCSRFSHLILGHQIQAMQVSLPPFKQPISLWTVYDMADRSLLIEKLE